MRAKLVLAPLSALGTPAIGSGMFIGSVGNHGP
jgi:hypothetical protein